jgi:hypothetical protein
MNKETKTATVSATTNADTAEQPMVVNRNGIFLRGTFLGQETAHYPASEYNGKVTPARDVDSIAVLVKHSQGLPELVNVTGRLDNPPAVGEEIVLRVGASAWARTAGKADVKFKML